MFRKITVSLKNTPAEQLKRGVCWGLIAHRPFANYYITSNRTTFYLTKKEFQEYNSILECFDKENN